MSLAGLASLVIVLLSVPAACVVLAFADAIRSAREPAPVRIVRIVRTRR